MSHLRLVEKCCRRLCSFTPCINQLVWIMLQNKQPHPPVALHNQSLFLLHAKCPGHLNRGLAHLCNTWGPRLMEAPPQPVLPPPRSQDERCGNLDIGMQVTHVTFSISLAKAPPTVEVGGVAGRIGLLSCVQIQDLPVWEQQNCHTLACSCSGCDWSSGWTRLPQTQGC